MRKLLILLRYVGGHLILIELAFYNRAGRRVYAHAKLKYGDILNLRILRNDHC
jgi:hypothetical protein